MLQTSHTILNSPMRIKKIRFLIFCCLISFAFPIQAQLHNDLQGRTGGKIRSVNLHGDVSYGSTAVTNRLMESYYKSEYIEKQTKEEVRSNMDPIRLARLGMDAGFGLNVEHYSDSLGKNNGLWFSLRDRTHLDAEFGRDAFELFFYGNKRFAGNTAEISNVDFTFLRYRTVELGHYKKYAFKKGVVYAGAGFAFVQGLNYFHLETLEHSSLYTDSDGEQIKPSVRMNIRTAKPNGSGLADRSGTGYAGSVFFMYTEKNHRTLRFEMEDLGQIIWKTNTEITSVDTSFLFSGVEIENLLKPSSNEFSEYDSTLLKKFYKVESYQYETLLPASFHLSYDETVMKGKLNLGGGLMHRLSASYSSLVYVKAKIMFARSFHLNLRAMYGGYTGFAAGMELGIQPMERISLNIGSNSISSLYDPVANNWGMYFGIRMRY